MSFHPGVIEIDGEPWFIAKDVLDVFDVQQGNRTTWLRNLGSDERGLKRIDTLGGPWVW